MISAVVTYTKYHFISYSKAIRKPTDYIWDILLIFEIIVFVIAAMRGIKSSAMIINLIAFMFIAYQSIRIKFILPKQCADRHNKAYPEPMRFSFSEKYFETNVAGTVRTYNYDELYKVVYVNHYFCVFVKKHSAFMIGEHELTNGSSYELSNLLKLKLDERFTIKS